MEYTEVEGWTRWGVSRERFWAMKRSKVAQSCPTLCDPIDCSLSGSSIYGIFQARVLEWIAISFSRGSPLPRNRTWVSRIAGWRFTFWATREAPEDRHYPEGPRMPMPSKHMLGTGGIMCELWDAFACFLVFCFVFGESINFCITRPLEVPKCF